MYVPRHFAVDDPADAVAMLRAGAFGHLVTAAEEEDGGGGGFDISPLPFVVDDELTTIRTHVARANGIWRLAPTAACLVVTVTDAYISPSWYPGKEEHGRVVPTWNYEVVYVHGRLVAHDTEWTLDLVRDLTDQHEVDRAAPWSVDDAPDGYIEQLGKAIVGLSIEVDRVEAKRKLSQNKPAPDVDGAIAGLRTSGSADDRAVAEAMARAQQDDG